MKKISVIVLVVVGLACSAVADAANHPKKRTRNANRVGPYAGAMIGETHYTGDQTAAESDLESTFNGVTTQNLTIGTKNKGIGYGAQFGYRFTRYIAAEFELTQFGELRSTARADVDLGSGFEPASIDLKFHSTGPKVSVIGILPLNDKFELYAQAGVMFTSSERQLVIRVNGQLQSFGSVKGDSTDTVFGVGAAWHVNQMYTVRLQFERLTKVGDEAKTGTEDFDHASLGLIVRF